MECLICYTVPQDDIKFDHGISTVICKLLKIPEVLFPGFFITSNVCFDCSQLLRQAQFLYQDLEDINYKIGNIYEVIEKRLVESQKLSEIDGNILQDRSTIVYEINSRNKKVEGAVNILNMIDLDIKCEIDSSNIFTEDNIDFDSPKSEQCEENPGNNCSNIQKELKVVIEPLLIPSNYKIANEPIGVFLRKNHENSFLMAEKLKNPRTILPYMNVNGLVNGFTNDIISSILVKEKNCENTLGRSREQKPKRVNKLAKISTKSEYTQDLKTQDKVEERLQNTDMEKIKKKLGRKPNKLKSQNKCSKCLKAFKTEYALRVHSFPQCNVSDEENTTCTKCSKSYKSPFHLREHIKFVHFKKLRYQCEKCPKKFCQPLKLKQHFLMNHTNERPYKCSTCPKGFVTGTRLRRHEALHTGVTNFICHICGFKYIILDSLKVHMRENHSGVKLKIVGKRKRKYSQRISKLTKLIKSQIPSEENE